MKRMTLEALLKMTEVPVLVKFGAVWCAPCRAMAPILESIASSWEGDIDLWELDVDDDPETANKWTVRSIPTLVLIDADGEELARMVGAQTKTSIETMLYRFFENPQGDT